MIDEKKLRELLSDLEAYNVERTTSTKNTDKFGEAICAFSNDIAGSGGKGYLLIGAADNGDPIGLEVTDELLKNLAAIRSDGNILPLPVMTVYKIAFEEGEIAVIEVSPGDLPPYKYKGRAWIRVGPRRAIAGESEERALSERRAARFKSFDATPCAGCGMEHLSRDLFRLTYLPNAVARETLERNNRSDEDMMASLQFYDPRENCATMAGALMFAKDPLFWLPGAYIQFVRFEGRDMASKVLSEKTFSGDMPNLLRELDFFVELLVDSRPERKTALQEGELANYPVVALRELLMNSILHRDYHSSSPVRFLEFDDRIEIQNPGGLYPEASPENFPRLNTYRNPIIAAALCNLGYVNRFGRGVYSAAEALKANGNPEPEFMLDQASHFLVTIRRGA